MQSSLRSGSAALIALAAAFGSSAAAQSVSTQLPGHVFTLPEALDYALEHYPTVKAAIAQVSASVAGIDVARSARLPRFDSMWQLNRATTNNIFGQVLPQSVLPSMSGPVLSSSSAQSVWGSAVGGLLSWEPWDFGLRDATVQSAEAALKRSRADEVLTRLAVQTTVAAAYLAVVAAEQGVTAAQADADRRDVLARTVHALVDNQLRAGAEASRADAERAAAQTRLSQARQARVLAQTTLARVLGIASGPVSASDAALLSASPGDPGDNSAPVAHPLAQVQQAAVELARAQEQVLSLTDRPRLYLQSSVFARGSGASPDGRLDGGLSGVGFERANWAAGVQVIFPNLFDFASLRARRAALAASTRAEAARFDESVLIVTAQQQTAAAMLDTARAVAANTPVQLASAQLSESQAQARYQSGLAGIVEVAEAQNLLAQAEFQDRIARLDVWRAILAEAVANGDLAPFIDRLRPPQGGR